MCYYLDIPINLPFLKISFRLLEGIITATVFTERMPFGNFCFPHQSIVAL